MLLKKSIHCFTIISKINSEFKINDIFEINNIHLVFPINFILTIIVKKFENVNAISNCNITKIIIVIIIPNVFQIANYMIKIKKKIRLNNVLNIVWNIVLNTVPRIININFKINEIKIKTSFCCLFKQRKFIEFNFFFVFSFIFNAFRFDK